MILFNKKLENKILSESMIFDTNYKEEENSLPKRYQTSYSQLVKSDLKKLLEELKAILTENAAEYAKMFSTAIITDKNGYVIATINEYSREKIKNSSIENIILNDDISQNSAKNTEISLFQVYMKEAGIRNIDLSMPIFFLDKHWGCLRAEYNFF